jgi:hypothetical protein
MLPMTPLIAVRSTMILATLAWAAGEVLMRRSRRADRWARTAWTVAIVLAGIHVVLAFHFVYRWDHDVAVAETARQAAERFGWGWRGSLYVNYAFLVWWLADVCWWWAAPASHLSRSLRFEIVRLAAFTFMFVNGAVVFASGAGRLAGIGAIAAVLLASPASRPRTRLT